jgi:hypothetical protein
VSELTNILVEWIETTYLLILAPINKYIGCGIGMKGFYTTDEHWRKPLGL